ncbi:hypothetical protein ID866_6611 [Astraeus odoratus]|nr:hypothetical protein ID866_6611 [Astraeus odoratus]
MHETTTAINRAFRALVKDAVAILSGTLSAPAASLFCKFSGQYEKVSRPTEVADERPLPLANVSPVVSSAEFALLETNIVRVNQNGIKHAAEYILRKISTENYTPRSWRTQPLHMCAPEPYRASDPFTKQCLNWIFLISALNFSFWSEKEGTPERYGVEWQKGWDTTERAVHTGYWSLVAALNRGWPASVRSMTVQLLNSSLVALEENIPITDPSFYSSESLCPDSLIAHVFRAAAQCKEQMPLLNERIAIMREVGSVLCNILVAETWAAFYPEKPTDPHPIFPAGPAIGTLTMFADYRIPQILHHMRILEYPDSLVEKLRAGTYILPGSKEEISLRAASIVAVERVREEILLFRAKRAEDNAAIGDSEEVSSVLIDFYLWDLAKKIERGEERIEGVETSELVPAHRTRSIWY